MPKWTSARMRAGTSSGPASTSACRAWTAKSLKPWWTPHINCVRIRRPRAVTSTSKSTSSKPDRPAREMWAGHLDQTIHHFTRRTVMSTERKVAVITGASQGIGAGLVRGFLDRGYRVVANSRSIQPDASADVLAVPGDVADPAVADRVIGQAVERFGRVDTLVNNAGVFVAKPFTEYTADDYAKVLTVNL